MSVRIASMGTSDEFASIRNGRYRENWVAMLTVRSWPTAAGVSGFVSGGF
jgi:hypothetical protein